MADDFDFSDDDFDGLPENALQELEVSAIRLTQHPTVSQAGPPLPRKQPPADQYELDDYDDDDEDVIDLGQQGAVFQQPSRNGNVQSVRSLPVASTAREPTSTLPHGQPRRTHNGENHVGSQTAMQSYAELQARLKELEQENASLKNSTTSLGGEVSIVRSKYDKSTKEYERKLAVMQQTHAEEVAKQKAELVKIRKERETAETNNRFLEHDLAQEIGRSKNVKKTLKDGNSNKIPAVASPAVTPKKSRGRLFGDGFDDDDILMVSPTKSQGRSKPTTPKHGAKRKRSVVDSPVLPMQPIQEQGSSHTRKSADSVVATEIAPDILAKLGKEDHRFEFLQRVLDYCPLQKSERFFETLTKFYWPSSPDATLASTLFQRISSVPKAGDVEEFPEQFFRMLMDVWSQCIKETYFEPVNVVVDTLQRLLTYERQKTATLLTNALVPLIDSTVNVVALPIGRASSAGKNAQKEPTAEAQIQNINVLACLELLYDLALSCTSTSPEATSNYWEQVQHDFILLLLMKAQPVSQIQLTLQIVATSALPTRFGASASTDTTEQRTRRETLLLDRLTNLLFEMPNLESHTGPAASFALWSLRVEIITTLATIGTTPNGGTAMSRHRFVIGRLIRFLNDAIDALYAFLQSSHSQTITAVNLCTRLLHHLFKTHADIIDVRAKLSAVQGGAHKHLVALTRLAFSDALVLERGIEDEVVDMAHQLLDEFLSPEEGEALLQVFSSGKSAG